MPQAGIGSSTRKRKAARLHLHSQSVFPEVSCCKQAIPLIEAVWSQYFRVPAGRSATRKLSQGSGRSVVMSANRTSGLQ